MANEIAVTAAKVGLVDPIKAETKPYLAGAAITKGQIVAVDTDGTIDPADASDGGGYLYEQVVGVALNTAAIGQPVSVLHDGEVYGFTVAALDVGAIVYLSSDTAGSLSTISGEVLVRLGRVYSLTDKPQTKVVRIQVDFAQALWVT